MRRPWKAWERHVILAYSEHDNELTDDGADEERHQLSPDDDVDNGVDWVGAAVPPDRDCSTVSLEQSLNELQLMRVEQRGGGDVEEADGRRRRLLYLGDVHTDRAQRPFYRPQSYQQPLVGEDVRTRSHHIAPSQLIPTEFNCNRGQGPLSNSFR